MQTAAKLVLYAGVYFVVPLNLSVGSIARYEKMECTDCAHYVICKSLNNTGIFAEFPKVNFLSYF